MKKMKETKSWPMLLDLTKDECKQTLRALELSAYSKIVSVLRAQGELTKEKRKLLGELQSAFSISVERHRAEIRRAINDEVLNTLAETLAGPNTSIEWSIEGRRLVPLMPRVPPQVAYTALATRMAQLYCGINAQTPNPCDTDVYGKLDDVGAEMDMTDSEEETEGLRYITEDMIPQQYNADQGHYTTLPLSQARLAKEKMKEKEAIDSSKAEPPALSSPLLSSSMSSGSNTSAASTGGATQPPGPDLENRKRKRSPSSGHPPAHSPPPPPVPVLGGGPLGVPNVQPLQSNITSIKQLPSVGPNIVGSTMKITVTGGITRTSSAASVVSTGSAQQKVILVSTSSAATGQTGSTYQRSISVPILKTASHGVLGGIPSVLGGPALQTQPTGVIKSGLSTPVLPPSATSAPSALVSKLRPRFSSAVAPSVLSQGSSSLPGLPSRPTQRLRSNSLVLQTEASSGVILSQGAPLGADTSTVLGSSVNFLGGNTLQLRSGQTITPKNSIQVKQEGGKLITHTIVASSALGSTGHCTTISASNTSSGVGTPNIVSSRIISRTGIPSIPTSSQGLYVVSTSSGAGTIVVTRTVASASLSGPRVVTVNTINSSRSSVVRVPPPTSVMSVGMNPKVIPAVPTSQQSNIRPVATKSNLIVVHKGSIALRDLSAKIIAKNNSQVVSGNAGSSTPALIGNAPPGILSGTLLVRSGQSGSSTGKRYTSVISNSSKDTRASGSANSISNVNNMIVVDRNCGESAASGGALQSSSNVLNTSVNVQLPSRVTYPSQSVCKSSADSTQISTTVRRDNIAASMAPCSHEITTVSASSSLPTSLKPSKCVLLASERDEIPLSGDGDTAAELLSPAELVSSSTDGTDGTMELSEDCDNKAILTIGEEEQCEMEEEQDEDNEWLKLGLEEEEEEIVMEGDEDGSSGLSFSMESSARSEKFERDGRSSVLSSSTEKSEGSGKIGEDEKTFSSDKGGKLEEDVGKKPKATSETACTSRANGKDGEVQMLVEKAVEVLQGGDSDQARTLLYKAGFELIESTVDQEHSEGESFSISNIAPASSSGEPLSSSTPLRDESSLGSMSELDATTGYFYSPSAGENSSDQTSMKGDSPTLKDDDSLPVPEFEDENIEDE